MSPAMAARPPSVMSVTRRLSEWNVREVLERGEVRGTDRAVGKVIGNVDPSGVLGNFEDRAAEFLDRGDRGFFGFAEHDLRWGFGLFLGFRLGFCLVLGLVLGLVVLGDCQAAAGQQDQCQKCDEISHASLLRDW